MPRKMPKEPPRHKPERSPAVPPTVLALMAHPDDIEITCAGTLALLHAAGWRVHMATMTAGDLGSPTLPRAEISRVRRREAAASATVLGAGYTCLGFDDLCISYDEAAKRRVSVVVREVAPDLLILPSPADYMADHQETARIAREAAYASAAPGWITPKNGKPTPPLPRVPVVLYADAIENVDHFGRPVAAHELVDISDVIDIKERMLACHESQRAWLFAQHGEDDYLRWMRGLARDRARAFGRKSVEYAEGFVRHLGYGYPKDDMLVRGLGRQRVKTVSPDDGAGTSTRIWEPKESP